ncbi:response regulator [Panacibacter ginsenosidivorans]|uniref:Response regulator n=1 Tax=Panacibacter ginsenosidivorans TaxID=1813871 RepID=A0A5B8VB41_9BACT|nr:response regulator [Panacibacter ginsenosidivorans]QEC68111.1 response regulator [Panacibacter ginsenosidivorans]
MKKIMIIDDDNKNIFALSATLKAKGYATVSATSAAEGIQQLKEKEEIGIVLMDMMMPEMDGYEALRVIRNEEQIKELPVIAVTAQAMKGDREKCIAAGADNYIAKPVDVDALLALVEKYLK